MVDGRKGSEIAYQEERQVFFSERNTQNQVSKLINKIK